jgi:hypothetical protein
MLQLLAVDAQVNSIDLTDVADAAANNV